MSQHCIHSNSSMISVGSVGGSTPPTAAAAAAAYGQQQQSQHGHDYSHAIKQEQQQEQANASSHHHNNTTTTTGRKGDPRMHRAVAARLADPSLTLFQALVMGGFDYTVDDYTDSSCMDRYVITNIQITIVIIHVLQVVVVCFECHGSFGTTSFNFNCVIEYL